MTAADMLKAAVRLGEIADLVAESGLPIGHARYLDDLAESLRAHVRAGVAEHVDPDTTTPIGTPIETPIE